jgi:hypothetical protein
MVMNWRISWVRIFNAHCSPCCLDRINSIINLLESLEMIIYIYIYIYIYLESITWNLTEFFKIIFFIIWMFFIKRNLILKKNQVGSYKFIRELEPRILRKMWKLPNTNSSRITLVRICPCFTRSFINHSVEIIINSTE